MPTPLDSTTSTARPLRLLIALSALTFLISCGDSVEERLAEAGDRIGAARTAATPGPSLPQDCRDHTIIRPKLGERLDALALRYAWALADEHARTDRCAEWYDQTHGGPR